MMRPNDGMATPREEAESEEQELAERMAAERGADDLARRDQDDPREEDGWTQPESSAQKGAARDEG
jgi:hypothetical protein